MGALNLSAPTGGSTTVSGFTPGQTITFTFVNQSGTGEWSLKLNGAIVIPLTNNSPVTYTFTATTNDNLQTFVSGNNNQDIVNATCGAIVNLPAGTTNSQKIRSLQNSITTTVATTSGQVITNQIEGAINDAFSPNGTPTNFGPTGGFINFAADTKSDIATRTDEVFSALAYAGGANKAPNFYKAAPRLDREWSVWADIRGTGWKINDTIGNGNDLKGNQVNITAGVGRKLDVDTLIGVVVGYEFFKYDVASLGGSLKGNGETIGGYFSRKFGGNLRFDAALGWTYLNYNASVNAGATTGSFNGSRWLASTGLTGTYKVDVYTFEPSAKIYTLWESEKAWTDSAGTAQASRTFSAGRVALGSKVGRTFAAANGWTVTPNAGLYGDWRFQTDNAIPTGTPVANISAGWSGRVTAGLLARAADGCTVSLDGDYSGLGANYKIWTGNLRVTVPFGAQSAGSR